MTGSLALFTDLMVRSTLLILFALAATALLRKCGASAAMRHQIWLWAIAGLFLLPVLAISLPALPVAVLPEAAPPAPVLVPITDAAPAAVAATSQPPSSLPDVLLSIYLAVAAGMLVWLLTAQRELTRLWRSAVPADPDWADLMSEAAADLRLSDRVELRLACGSVMPMTWGTRVPKIILPAEARHWTAARRRFVLLHELGHVRRRDSLTQTAAAIARTMWWFHPGSWFAARQLRLEQELAADDLALGAGAPPNGYARNLLELACAFCLPAPAMARKSQLEQRLVAIVRPGSRRTPGPGFGALAACFVLAATWLAATAIPVERVTATPLARAVADRVADAASLTQLAPAATAVPAVPSATPALSSPPVRAAAAVEQVSSNAYDDALGRYRREKAAYDGSLETYGVELTDYERRLSAYERVLADYRLRLATYQADSSGRMTPPIPPLPPIPPIPPTPPIPPIPLIPGAA
jgi:beta-lactamase regulating signal transducer with metallopeptidase domain